MKLNLFRFNNDKVQQLEVEIAGLKDEITVLKDDIKRVSNVNNEIQKNNELLFPDHYDKSSPESKTVFVKDGKEKELETIDWRSR